MALHEYQKKQYQKIGVIAALIILPIVGFFAGMQYQIQTGQTANSTKGQITGGGPQMFRGGTFGTVKAVSDTSITVTQLRDDTDKTLTLDASTAYKNGTETAARTDIKVGDMVMVELDGNKAKAVTINPAMQGPQMQTSGDGGAMMIQ